MLTKSGKATVTFENRLVPIAYDGDCASEPIAEPTVEAALKSFDWKRGYLGFKFAEVATAKVTLNGSTEEISFTQQKKEITEYLFAEKIVSLEDFKQAAEYQIAYERAKMFSAHLLEGNAVIYDGPRGLRFLDAAAQKDAVLINKQGRQLWPQPKA